MNFDSDQASITPVSQTYLRIDSTGGLWLPGGTTGERPGSPPGPIFRYNTDSNQVEYWNGSAWTSPGGSSGISSIAVSVGSTSPTGSSKEIAWSTTINEYVYWTGTNWQLLRDRANADATVVDWFSSADAQFNGTTIDLTIGRWAFPPVAYASGQTILLLTRSNEQAYNGVYTLGSVSNLAAVPLTRHAEWPSTRVVANGHRFYVKNVYRKYSLTGVPEVPGTTITGEFVSAGVDTVNDRITLNYSEYPQQFEPGTKVRFTTTGTLPAGLSAGVDYYIYYAYRERYLSLPTLVIADALAGTPINLTSVGSGTGTITIQPRWGSNLVHDVGNIGLITLKLTEWESTFGGTVQGKAAITAHWAFEESALEPEVDSPGTPANQTFGDPVTIGGSVGAGTAIGAYSVSTGSSGGTAIGLGAVAAGNGIAIGGAALIAPSGDGTFSYDSISIGTNAVAFGGSSIAIGANAKTENNSLAIGQQAVAQRSGVTIGNAIGYNPQEVVIAGAYASGIDNISPPETRAISFQSTLTGNTETALQCGGQDGTGLFQPKLYAVLPENGCYVVDGEISAHDQTDGLYGAVWSLFGVLNAQVSGGTCSINGYVVAAVGTSAKNLKFRVNYDSTNNRLEVFVTGIASKDTYWRAIIRLRGHKINPYGGFSLSSPELVAPPGVFLLPASEALSSGQLVNIWSDPGVAKVRPAARNLIRQADGYVVNNYATGEVAAVFTTGANPFLSGLTVGELWLSTSGGVQSSAPVAGLSQQVGFATSATSFVFQRGLPVQIT